MNIGHNLDYLTTIAAEYVEKTEEFSALKKAGAAIHENPRLSPLLSGFESMSQTAYLTENDAKAIDKEFERLSTIAEFRVYFSALKQFSSLIDGVMSSLNEKIARLF